jgi:hypothetical protein
MMRKKPRIFVRGFSCGVRGSGSLALVHFQVEAFPDFHQSLSQLLHHRVGVGRARVKRRRSVPRGTVGKLIGCT